MKQCPFLSLPLIALFALTSCKKEIKTLDFFEKKMTRQVIHISKKTTLYPIGSSFYRHETLFEFPGFGEYPSNGLIFMKNGKALLVDTPPSEELTRELTNYLKDSLHTEIIKVIPCHYHMDNLGGLSYLQKNGVQSLSLKKTKEICLEKSLPFASETFDSAITFTFEGERVQCNYFGGGHTVDNSIVYFPSEKVLFGGCLIKELSSQGLGNMKEAVVSEWDSTIEKLQATYPEIETVVPGHGEQGGPELLNHTIALVKKAKKSTE